MNSLYLNTVTLDMQQVMTALMDVPELQNFRLVSGTSLSLQLGHRISGDLDFFTDRPTNFEMLSPALRAIFSDTVLLSRSVNGQTWRIEGVKCCKKDRF